MADLNYRAPVTTSTHRNSYYQKTLPKLPNRSARKRVSISVTSQTTTTVISRWPVSRMIMLITLRSTFSSTLQIYGCKTCRPVYKLDFTYLWTSSQKQKLWPYNLLLPPWSNSMIKLCDIWSFTDVSFLQCILERLKYNFSRIVTIPIIHSEL